MSAITQTRFSTKHWTCGATTRSSVRHLAQGRPGQDAAFARLNPRPLLLVADGRGSSEHSEIGATMAAECVSSFVDRNESLVSECLDRSEGASSCIEEQWKSIAQLLRDTLVARQIELARVHTLDSGDLEFTLAAAVIGRNRIGVIQVGDSSVAIERRLEVVLALPPDRGEFANETNFVSPREGADSLMVSRVFPLRGITGLVAFTDGLSQLWMDTRTLAMAPGVGRIVRNLGDGVWDHQRLGTFLDLPIWQKQDDDDKGVAYLAKRTQRAAKKNPRS